MKILLKILIIVFLVPVFVSCSSVKYVVDYDNSINFLQYQTYNYTPSADSIPMNQLNKRRLFNAISSEMNQNNIKWAAEPDIFVHLHMIMSGSTKTNVTYGHGESLSLGSGFSNTYMDLSEYSEGSLFIDIIDANQNQLVWTGKIIRNIKDANPISEKEIQNMVQRIFHKFPPHPPK